MQQTSTASTLPLALVIVTRNRRESLVRTLEHLQALEAPYHIVVVDNASTDDTAATVREQFPTVQLVTRTSNIGAVARNDGVRVVQQPYIAFADDDSWWAHGALSRAIELFERYPRLALIMSRIVVGLEQRPDPCCDLMQRSPLARSDDLPGIPILGFVACGAIVRRSAFLQANGFHPAFGSSGEEALLAMDLASKGWGLSYVDTIVSHHHPSTIRNVTSRRIDGVRDELWTVWLRRPRKEMVRVTVKHLRAAPHDRISRLGLLAALRGLPWVLRQRVPVALHLERQLQLLDQQQEAT
jgi:GT2 family glycosyltransferase